LIPDLEHLLGTAPMQCTHFAVEPTVAFKRLKGVHPIEHVTFAAERGLADVWGPLVALKRIAFREQGCC
jgi:hypothetical protein